MGPRNGQGRMAELGRALEGVPETGRNCSTAASTSLASPVADRRFLCAHPEGRLRSGAGRCLRLRQDGDPNSGHRHRIALIFPVDL